MIATALAAFDSKNLQPFIPEDAGMRRAVLWPGVPRICQGLPVGLSRNSVGIQHTYYIYIKNIDIYRSQSEPSPTPFKSPQPGWKSSGWYDGTLGVSLVVGHGCGSCDGCGCGYGALVIAMVKTEVTVRI